MQAISLYLAALMVSSPASLTELISAEEGLYYGNVSWAIEHLERALKLDPDDPDALFSLATVYLEQREMRDARPLLDRIIELDPYDDDARFLLAQTLWQLDERDQARAVLYTLLMRHPKSEAGLALLSKLDHQVEPPGWLTLLQNHTRLEVGAGYDSNVTFENDASNVGEWLTTLQAEATLWNAHRALPISVTGYAHSTQKLSGDESIDASLPSRAGITLEYAGYLGWLALEFRADLAATFTDQFAYHYRTDQSASVLGRWAWSRANYSELEVSLTAVEAAQASSPTSGSRTRIAAAHFFRGDRLSLGFTGWLRLGSGYMPGQDTAYETLSGLSAFSPEDTSTRPPAMNTPAELGLTITLEHNEVGLQGIIDVDVTDTWLVYGLVALVRLDVDGTIALATQEHALDEWFDLTLSTLVGVEYTLSENTRIFTEYSFTDHQSTAGLTFTRQMGISGLRFTYP